MPFEFVKAYVVTEEDVYNFFYNWIIEARTGKCISIEESAAASADEVASDNTRDFFKFMDQVTSV